MSVAVDYCDPAHVPLKPVAIKSSSTAKSTDAYLAEAPAEHPSSRTHNAIEKRVQVLLKRLLREWWSAGDSRGDGH